MSKWTRANPLAAVPGYNVPQGHFANGYTNGGDRVAMRAGGRIGFKKGTDKKWMQKVSASIKKEELKENVHRLQNQDVQAELKH